MVTAVPLQGAKVKSNLLKAIKGAAVTQPSIQPGVCRQAFLR